jgi:hypothetical protein
VCCCWSWSGASPFGVSLTTPCCHDNAGLSRQWLHRPADIPGALTAGCRAIPRIDEANYAHEIRAAVHGPVHRAVQLRGVEAHHPPMHHLSGGPTVSVEAMSAVLHHSRAKGTAKLVLLGIANHQGDGGAWPAVSTLARYANTTPRSVQRAIDALCTKGELVREVQAGGGRDVPDHSRPNRYDVVVTCPPWCDRTTHHRDTRERRQPGLWIKGVTPVSGGDASVRGGVTPVSPGGVTPVSPEPSLRTHPPQVVPQLQDAREPDGWCSVCSRRRHQCAEAQRTLAAEDRHAYQPRPRP